MNTNIVHINGVDEFETVALNSDRPIAVDFWAEWCGPCKALGPTLEAVADEVSDRASIAKVNVDEPGNSELAARYGISSIPTILYFKEGELKDTSVGLLPKDAIVDRLNSLN